MGLSIQVTFRGMDPSPALEERIREKAEKLARFHDHITGIDVVVQGPPGHHHKGGLYEVRLDISVPGAELVVNREPGKDHSHEDPYVAVRDAFAAAQRQLQDHVRVRRGDVKRHDQAG